MQSFVTAKFMLSLLILVGWIVVAIAVIAFFLPGLDVALGAKIAGTVAACLYGFVLVAIGQMGLAQIATAENTKRMLDILEGSPGVMNRQNPAVANGGRKIEPVFSKER